ncbi:phosphotransferase [Actinomadura macra]|uniref:phosphotransferase n=1 Tax=Actinomadura macra TaxID=46164 RepID=UPI00083120AF|nr:phosphotransferase [Actinomadura macra]
MTGRNEEMPGRGLYTEAARRARLEWLRRATGSPLATLERTGIPARDLMGNVENYVATVEVPVGLAGPLLFRGDAARGPVTVPLATTEGALVASAARGAKAITRAGGVETRVIAQRMTRAPVFEFDGIAAADRFARWVTGLHAELAEQIGAVSRHSRLVELDPVQIGRAVHLRFVYETADAGGQNMTTAATWRACGWINDRIALMPDLAPVWFAVEGNMSGDKKLTHLNMIAGRGTRVTAECVLDRETVRRVLKTTPEAIDRGYRIGIPAAQQAGMIGFDIDAANVIAAVYTATGQDIASVYESSGAMFYVEPDGTGLRATLLLPNLLVGTVGGGTGLPRQRDYLEALGCAGDGGMRRLAEIICGFSLAVDLSTIAAITGGQFADAHERLGRPRRVDWLTRADLDAPLLETLLADGLDVPELKVREVTVLPTDDAPSGLLTEIAARGESRKLTGLFPLRVGYTGRDGAGGTLDLVAKVKPLDDEVIIEAAKLAALSGGALADLYATWRDWTGFKDVHTREPALYRSGDPALARVLPAVYGVHVDPAREAYVILMERLGPDVILMDAADRPGLWRGEHVRAAVRGIAGVHAAWLGREDELIGLGWLGRVQSAERMAAMAGLWTAMAEHNAAEHPHWITPDVLRRLRRIIGSAGDWWARLERLPRTLVHNDFNPRNIALREADLSLVAYDWELATLHVPQRDLAELLAYVLPADAGETEVSDLLDLHRAALRDRGAAAPGRDSWREGYRLALWDFSITRLQLYLMAHTHRELPFLEHLVPTVLRLLEIEDRAEEAVGAC